MMEQISPGLVEQVRVAELLEQLHPRLIVSALTAIRLAAVLYGAEENALLSPRREERLVRARALAVWVLRSVPSVPVSYPKIGRALGDRHHTTIINLHVMAIGLRLEDETFARCCTAITEYFKLTEGSYASHC